MQFLAVQYATPILLITRNVKFTWHSCAIDIWQSLRSHKIDGPCGDPPIGSRNTGRKKPFTRDHSWNRLEPFLSRNLQHIEPLLHISRRFRWNNPMIDFVWINYFGNEMKPGNDLQCP